MSPHDAQRIEDVLARDGVYVGTPVGVSMRPMLRNRRDTIVVRPPQGPLKRHDVALYVRDDGAYVLHRVLAVRDGAYVIRGDNCTEREYVGASQVIGVLVEFFRDERRVDMHSLRYRAYVNVWCAIAPLRIACKKLRARLARTPLRSVYRALKSALGA